jgi:hypothetical protein
MLRKGAVAGVGGYCGLSKNLTAVGDGMSGLANRKALTLTT